MKNNLLSLSYNFVVLTTMAAVLSACSANTQQTGSIEFSDQSQGIVGGRSIDPSSPMAKHTVGLYGVKGEGGFICTGTLVATNIILTAAHCVETEKMLVIFSHDIEGTLVAKDLGRVRPVVAKTVHPKWNGGVNDKDNGDIALIKFKGSAPLGFVPAALLSSSIFLKPGVFTQQAGFGLDNPEMDSGSGKLRTAMVRIHSNTHSATEIIVDQRDGRGVCSGDSGGPAFMVIDGSYYVWGVASAVTLNPKCREFGIYTNALSYRDWIREGIQILALRGNL